MPRLKLGSKFILRDKINFHHLLRLLGNSVLQEAPSWNIVLDIQEQDGEVELSCHAF